MIRPAVWDESDVLPWLRQNAILFAHGDLIAGHAGLAALEQAQTAPLSLVHPDLYGDRMEAAGHQIAQSQQVLHLLAQGGLFRIGRTADGHMTVARVGD